MYQHGICVKQVVHSRNIERLKKSILYLKLHTIQSYVLNVTKLPVDQYNVDAAILYKDIMSPLPAIGVDVEIKSGIGPVIDNPIRSLQDVEKLGKSIQKMMYRTY